MLPTYFLPNVISKREHSKEWPAARSSAFQDFLITITVTSLLRNLTAYRGQLLALYNKKTPTIFREIRGRNLSFCNFANCSQ